MKQNNKKEIKKAIMLLKKIKSDGLFKRLTKKNKNKKSLLQTPKLKPIPKNNLERKRKLLADLNLNFVFSSPRFTTQTNFKGKENNELILSSKQERLKRKSFIINKHRDHKDLIQISKNLRGRAKSIDFSNMKFDRMRHGNIDYGNLKSLQKMKKSKKRMTAFVAATKTQKMGICVVDGGYKFFEE